MLTTLSCPAIPTARLGVAAPRFSRAARGLARVPGAAAAIRRWQLRRWLKRNRDRMALISTLARDAHELSELGRRVRAETLRELQDRLRDLRLRDPD